MSFVSELKRRNVFRVALFYVVAAWVVVQVAETVLPVFEVPDSMLRGLVILLALGLVPAVILAWVFEWTPDGIRRESEIDAGDGVRRQTANKLNWATLIVALLAIVLLLADRLLPEPAPTTPPQAGNEAVRESQPDGVAGIADASIAVLPFADLSPGGDQAYFSDGIAEEILNVLVRVDGLEVASRTSSFGFKGRESLGIPAIAEALKVRHVLEGSVRRAGDSVRVTAQLIDAATDRHLWSDTFDRPLSAENLFAIQDEVASAIVAALVDSLGIEVAGEVTLAAPTQNLSAYDLYLQARARFQARNALDEADALLQAAVEQDPGFAKAWELRAAVQSLMKEYGYSELSNEELGQRVVEFAQRALDLDPASGLALATLASFRSRASHQLRARHDHAAIIRDLERALELDPANSSALNWLGMALGAVGRLEEALDVFGRCGDVDPDFGPCAENEYDALWTLGRPEEALAHFQAALDRGAVVDEYVNVALLAHFEQKSTFMFALNQSKWLPGWRRHEEIYEAFRNLQGDHSALAAELIEFSGAQPGGSNDFLDNLLIPLGAYDLLPYPMYIWGPEYAKYRRSPEFQRYIRDSGIAEYWRAHGYPPQCRPIGKDDFQCD